MPKSWLLLTALSVALIPAFPDAQRFMDHAEIQHRAASAIVTANDARPLDQAITALSQEYGWAIDYEDPPYSSQADVVDSGDPQWRAAHPSDYPYPANRWIPAGGFFQSEYPETPTTRVSPLEEEGVLRKLVADYNHSGNPGKFTVRKETDSRFAVVGEYIRNDAGQDVRIAPLLDTPLSIPVQTRSVYQTLDLILTKVSSATGSKVGLCTGGMNPDKPLVAVGGDGVPARTLLLKALEPYRTIVIWHMRYSPPRKDYCLIPEDVVRVQHAIFGHEKLVPVFKR